MFSKEKFSAEHTTMTGKSLERTYKHPHSISVREFAVVVSQYYLGVGHFKCSDTLRHVSSIYPLLCNPHFSPDTNTTFLHWFVRIKDVRISNFFSIINPGLQFYRQIKYLALFIKKRGFLPYLL